MDPIQETNFALRVRQELASAKREGEAPVHNLHEGYALILGKVDALWDKIRTQGSYPDKTVFVQELVKIAARCQMVAEDLRLPVRAYLPKGAEE